MAAMPAPPGMAGLVVGIEVTGPDPAAPASAIPPRRFSLVLREEPNRYGNRPGYRMDLEGTDAPRLDPGPVPGPGHRAAPRRAGGDHRREPDGGADSHSLARHRGRELLRRRARVWRRRAAACRRRSSRGSRSSRELTPPRAGTFIYHTHWHDEAQLAGGLYGPLIVLEPGERYRSRNRPRRGDRPQRRA